MADRMIDVDVPKWHDRVTHSSQLGEIAAVADEKRLATAFKELDEMVVQIRNWFWREFKKNICVGRSECRGSLKFDPKFAAAFKEIDLTEGPECWGHKDGLLWRLQHVFPKDLMVPQRDYHCGMDGVGLRVQYNWDSIRYPSQKQEEVAAKKSTPSPPPHRLHFWFRWAGSRNQAKKRRIEKRRGDEEEAVAQKRASTGIGNSSYEHPLPVQAPAAPAAAAVDYAPAPVDGATKVKVEQ